MSISRELGPKYDNVPPEVRAAEIARRQKMSESVSNYISQLSPEDQVARVARMHNLSPEAKAAKYKRVGDAQRGKPRPPLSLSEEAEAARIQAIGDAIRARIEAEVPLRQELKLRNRKGEAGLRSNIPNGVWSGIEPFVLRNALTGEIMELTGFSYAQVTNAIFVKSHVKNSPIKDYSKPENRRDRMSRSHMGKRWGVPVNPLDTESQRKEKSLVKAFTQVGLITEDTHFWKRLAVIYEQQGRELPQSFSQRLLLEVYLRARNSNRDFPMDKYQKLIAAIDPQFFSGSLSEEFHLLDKAECRHHWVLGDPKEGIVHGDCKKCGDRKIYSEKSELNNAGRAFQLARKKGGFQKARQLT